MVNVNNDDSYRSCRTITINDVMDAQRRVGAPERACSAKHAKRILSVYGQDSVRVVEESAKEQAAWASYFDESDI